MTHANYLLPPQPLRSVADYRAIGGGDGLGRAHAVGPEATISQVTEARLRGRGGGGFPTGLKWSGIADATDQRRFVVCNAAEGEPGTFKDRALLRANPYQVLEGIAIAAFATGSEEAYVGIKEKYSPEIARLEAAATEMEAAGILGDIPIRIVTGPDDYLLGEEKGLLEAIEGRQPLPRWYPPYVVGLHTAMPSGVGAGTIGWDSRSNPTAVNNVETLANVAPIMARGSEWFRSMGTADSPGAMLFTVSGDVATETVAELPLGTPLAVLVHGYGGGVAESRQVKAVFPGASNAPLPASLLDTPMDFASMTSIGSGLGSGGMIVYDDTACVVGAALLLSRFLAIESCGQCPPCKLGTGALADGFLALESGVADTHTLDDMNGWLSRVTDANRCGLGAGERALAVGVLRFFTDDVVAHLGAACPSPRVLSLPKMIDWDREASVFTNDESYFAWRTA